VGICCGVFRDLLFAVLACPRRARRRSLRASISQCLLCESSCKLFAERREGAFFAEGLFGFGSSGLELRGEALAPFSDGSASRSRRGRESVPVGGDGISVLRCHSCNVFLIFFLFFLLLVQKDADRQDGIATCFFT